MKKIFFLSLLLLSIPYGAFAKLTNPSSLLVPVVGEKSAKVQWQWEDDKGVGAGTLAKFIIDGGPKRDALGNPVGDCKDIGDWFKIHEEPGQADREKVIKGLEKGTDYCWRVMAQAEDTKDNSDLVKGPDFKTNAGAGGAVCGNNSCEAGEDPVSCPKDCKVGGGGETPIDPSKLNPISATDIFDLLNKVLNFLFALSIFIVPVIVIYAAFLMLMGGGDPVKLQKGRMILFWTAVAFILILVSRGLPAVFRNLL
jgi:hypothetical protein